MHIVISELAIEMGMDNIWSSENMYDHVFNNEVHAEVNRGEEAQMRLLF